MACPSWPGKPRIHRNNGIQSGLDEIRAVSRPSLFVVGCCRRRMPSDSVRQVTTAARAFSLSRLRATAPSRREPGIAAARPYFCCLLRTAARDEERLPPGGSWQHRKVLTEGERGSNIAVKSREYGLVSPTHACVCQRPYAGVWGVCGLDVAGEQQS